MSSKKPRGDITCDIKKRWEAFVSATSICTFWKRQWTTGERKGREKWDQSLPACCDQREAAGPLVMASDKAG